MVSPYPPMRGGISAYAGQAASKLRQQGHEVVVASPARSDGEHIVDLTAPGSGRELAQLAGSCDRLIVQFQPEMLGPPGSALWRRGHALMRLAKGLRAAPNSELCLHEVNYGDGPFAPVLRWLVRPVWNLAATLTVHTERERHDFARAFRIDVRKIHVVSQGEHLLRRTNEDRRTARAKLGLSMTPVLLIAIGFLQPNKGFDRAIRAFAQSGIEDACLFVVGSVWREDASSRSHVHELRRLAVETPGVELREVYLDDADFDRWIVASDALVLPYRRGWSSNVMERGRLYERPVIMSRVGGMAEQGADRPGVTLVDDDDALVEALRTVVADVAARSADDAA